MTGGASQVSLRNSEMTDDNPRPEHPFVLDDGWLTLPVRISTEHTRTQRP